LLHKYQKYSEASNMTYVINSYSGTPIASIPDKTINTTATSLRLPGRNYPNYGEPVVENLVWMLENFAGAPLSGPSNPRVGQLWYDVANAQLKVYDGTAWKSAAPVQTTPNIPPPTPPGPTPPGPPSPPGPVNPVDGELLYDQTKKQLFVYGSSQWNLVGPLGAADGNDANSPSIPVYTNVDALLVTDTLNAIHKVLRLTVGGQLVAVVSNDATFAPAATPTNPLQGFTSVYPGITLNPTLPNAKFYGESTSTLLAQNSVFLGGIPSGSYMRRDQTNLPINDNLYNLGSTSFKYNTIYATNFDGKATSALNADTLGTPPVSPTIFMRKDATNIPTVDAVFDLGSLNTKLWTVFSHKFCAGSPSESDGPMKYVFKGDLQTGLGQVASNQLSCFISGVETARFVNRSLRLGDVTIAANATASPAFNDSFLTINMNQANTDGINIRSTVSQPFNPQPNTMINLWGSYPINPAVQKGISFKINTTSILNAYEAGSILFDVAGTYYNSLSDYRRKTNIAPLSQALELVGKVTAKTYNWVDSMRTDKSSGFLAHELQAVVPQAVQGQKDEVDENGHPVYQSVDNSKLVPILWAAVQELSQKLAALEAKLA
jgi:hypothetical protein